MKLVNPRDQNLNDLLTVLSSTLKMDANQNEMYSMINDATAKMNGSEAVAYMLGMAQGVAMAHPQRHEQIRKCMMAMLDGQRQKVMKF